MGKEDLDFFVNKTIQIDISGFVLSLICSVILSLLIQIFYVRFSSTLSNRMNFSKNFVILGVTTCIIIVIVKNSLALSLGLVGALSIVRFRAAIKEPEELVYLFFVISIGLSNGANQFLLSIFATLVIITFLFGRHLFEYKFRKNIQYSFDSNIININILNNDEKKIDEIIKIIKERVNYLKLKSANIEENTSSYIFWYNLDEKNINLFLNDIKSLSDKNVNISIYSKSNAHE